MKPYFFFFIYLLLALFSIVNAAGNRLGVPKGCSSTTSPSFCSQTQCNFPKLCPKECGLCSKSDD